MTKQVSNSLNLNKRISWRWLAGSLICLLTTVADAQTADTPTIQRCGVVQYEKILQQRNPDRLRQLNELNRLVEQKLAGEKSARSITADTIIYRIPIVVHVIHNTATQAIGGTNNVNISDEQIVSQIQVLNEDYRRQAGTSGYNTSAIGADARIEFYLANRDPSGNATTGITRNYYANKATFDIENDALLLSSIAYWPSDQYLNIWVTNVLDDPSNKINNYVGYTQFPTAVDTLKGLSASVDEKIDGSIIDYRFFGRNTGTVVYSLYKLGRTVSHEVGHWLGLIHPWGDYGGCNDDYVADTPLTADFAGVSVTSCKQTYSTCIAGKQTRDLVENYMMYSPDACMNMFTAGQVARMRAVLQLSPRRAKVVNGYTPPSETDNLTVTVSPNPTNIDPSVKVQLKGSQSFNVELFDALGRQLRALSYTNTASTQITLPVGGLAPGLYVVRVKTGTETVSKRLVVQ